MCEGRHSTVQRQSYPHTMWAPTAHSLCAPPPLLQVSTTSGIKVGQWVRLYALASSPARRRLQFATAPWDPRTPSSPPPAGASKNATLAPPPPQQQQPAPGSDPGVLPMPPALARLVAEGIENAESEQAGVSIAAQPGTIDAFIYGENLVDSGSSEWAARRARGAGQSIESSGVQHAAAAGAAPLLLSPSSPAPCTAVQGLAPVLPAWPSCHPPPPPPSLSLPCPLQTPSLAQTTCASPPGSPEWAAGT